MINIISETAYSIQSSGVRQWVPWGELSHGAMGLRGIQTMRQCVLGAIKRAWGKMSVRRTVWSPFNALLHLYFWQNLGISKLIGGGGAIFLNNGSILPI